MMYRVLEVFADICLFAPVIFYSFYMDELIGNPLEEQRKRKKLRSYSKFTFIVAIVGLVIRVVIDLFYH